MAVYFQLIDQGKEVVLILLIMEVPLWEHPL